jgi:hypothetical protein
MISLCSVVFRRDRLVPALGERSAPVREWAERNVGATLSGEGVPTEIDRREVERLVAEGAQLVDVLPRPEYEDDHLPHAVNIPLRELDGMTAASLDRRRPVVVYCHDSA